MAKLINIRLWILLQLQDPRTSPWNLLVVGSLLVQVSPVAYHLHLPGIRMSVLLKKDPHNNFFNHHSESLTSLSIFSFKSRYDHQLLDTFASEGMYTS